MFEDVLLCCFPINSDYPTIIFLLAHGVNPLMKNDFLAESLYDKTFLPASSKNKRAYKVFFHSETKVC